MRFARIALQGEFNEFDLNELFHFFLCRYRPISFAFVLVDAGVSQARIFIAFEF